jgi:CBS domain-containing protein
MNVGRICQRRPITIRAGDALTAAARLMREEHIGYLVVVAPEPSGNSAPGSDTVLRPIGVLTDRDIVVTVVAKETDPAKLTAGDVMNMQPITVGESDSLENALNVMRRVGVRRLPVVGRAGELVGVLSLDEVIDALAAEIASVAGAIRNERQVEGVLRT